ncbi:MAG: aminodeoxychorismate/anthranilate synthase component II [Candidatus Thermoplasmatota archaeon]|jgi:anthranilate synthase component 2|nr:aminodeoxychorismate/anthranilate synthase component II [Candidatus Thermoplasmatota archaeon]MCL5793747.1 aminodeoxychorismate/anthranilate synthase component II [Candidatus Thermoplasmatota archaeon]
MKTLLVNNYDSFVYNIVQVVRKLGFAVDVVENDRLDAHTYYDRVILSPGPGNPLVKEYRGNVMEFLKANNYGKVLGICFGHQTIGIYLGSNVRLSHSLMHGEIDTIENSGDLLFRGLPTKLRAVRYHSLVIDRSPEISVDAVSERDGEIMGFHDHGERYFGVQFHPESFYTDNGERIIRNFMEL